jgi:hypothetical protein
MDRAFRGLEDHMFVGSEAQRSALSRGVRVLNKCVGNGATTLPGGRRLSSAVLVVARRCQVVGADDGAGCVSLVGDHSLEILVHWGHSWEGAVGVTVYSMVPCVLSFCVPFSRVLHMLCGSALFGVFITMDLWLVLWVYMF